MEQYLPAGQRYGQRLKFKHEDELETMLQTYHVDEFEDQVHRAASLNCMDWLDNKLVAMISTRCSFSKHVVAQRKDKKAKGGIAVKVPEIVDKYLFCLLLLCVCVCV